MPALATATGHATWRRIDRLFDAALDLPPAERAAWLAAECGADEALRRQVEELLAAAGADAGSGAGSGTAPGDGGDPLITGGAGLLFERLVDGPPAGGQRVDDRGDGAPPPRVGRYRIVRELGRGGMAVVYLAERADGAYRQQVALKLIRPERLAAPFPGVGDGSAGDGGAGDGGAGDGGGETLRRFDQERQILASLSHPGIARLLDGGTSDQGFPYLVMELVDGERIDEYCDRRRLTVEQRLRLFLPAARAVEAAHRNLVVHRDIKPSNLLVADEPAGDGETEAARVKLLDFGIAKLLAGSPNEQLHTRTGGRLLTPAYASPEQIAGRPVTTASDVYQLGLLLYQLLTGRWPYSDPTTTASGEAHSALALARAICEEPASRPSGAVTADGDQRSGGRPAGGHPAGGAVDGRRLARLRGTTPGKLRRQLAGDLDRILLTALRKEPERRYRSVGALIDDLERYLAGRPIKARPDTLGYRARKFVRRHTAAVGAAAAAVVLIAGLVSFFTARLVSERDRARLAAEREEQVAEFLTGLFAVAAPTRTRGAAVSARQVLDRGAGRVAAELADQPALQAEMMTLMGDVYRELAHFDESRALLTRAVALRRDRPGPPISRPLSAAPHSSTRQRLELAESLHALAQLELATGRPEAACNLFGEALELRRAALGRGAPEAARSLLGLGRAAAALGEYRQAETLIRQSLAQLESALGTGQPAVGRARLELGRVLIALRDPHGGERELAAAVAVLERHLGSDHPHPLEATVELADVKTRLGQRREARRLYDEALPRLERAYGGDHPLLGDTLSKLAALLRRQSELDDALAAQRRALAIHRASLGEDSLAVAADLNLMALIERGRGELGEAERRFEESIATYGRTAGTLHPDAATPMENLAALLAERGETAAAAELLERTVDLRQGAFGPLHPSLSVPLHRLGSLRLRLGEPDAAEALYRRAIEVGLALGDPVSREHGTAMPRIGLGRALTAQRCYRAAEVLLSEPSSLPELEAAIGHLRLEAAAELYRSWGQPVKAAEIESELASREG